MIFIYCCYGGSHSSVTAAAAHLKLLSEGGKPAPEELMKVPYYDIQTNQDHGYFRYMGEDAQGNQVYIIGMHNSRKRFQVILSQIIDLLNLDRKQFVFVDTMPAVNWMMMVGGFTSRRLGWVKLGRPLVIRGTQNAFQKISKLVHRVKKNRIR